MQSVVEKVSSDQVDRLEPTWALGVGLVILGIVLNSIWMLGLLVGSVAIGAWLFR